MISALTSRERQLRALAAVFRLHANREAVDRLLDAVGESIALQDVLLAIGDREPSDISHLEWQMIAQIEVDAARARTQIEAAAQELGVEL
jgi:hypothetical protein